MKLLLTSGGITNEPIKKALFDLVGKNPEDTSLAFIPTASNVEKGDKKWLIEDLISLKSMRLKSIDFVDISAIDKSLWLPRMEKSDVLFFEGGNSYHLMEWINKSGLIEALPELLKTRVYVGVSAGTCVASKDLMLNITQKIYGEDMDKTQDMTGLNYVNFYALPHLNNPYFKNARKEIIQNAIQGIKEKIYVLDDECAIKVMDDKIEIVSEGQYLEFN